ncbi:hypothetical protein CVT25_012777 [Psilocybe cyanescens]|uniref:Uncharacterized protein n=1 Tax=Psilocybe cyanescens TaxID=93625 RepID=A0A409XTD3_PSICY|nr:hypothetical protein CVT25_012777 [Psilocybe cyanescens]
MFHFRQKRYNYSLISHPPSSAIIEKTADCGSYRSLVVPNQAMTGKRYRSVVTNRNRRRCGRKPCQMYQNLLATVILSPLLSLSTIIEKEVDHGP